MHAWQKLGFKVSKLATVYVKGFLWFALSQIQQYFMKRNQREFTFHTLTGEPLVTIENTSTPRLFL